MPVTPKDKKAGKTESQADTAIVPQDAPSGELVDLGGDFVQALEVYPRLDTSPPFLLAYHPQKWDVIEGYCLPALATVAVEAGVNNVENVTRGGKTVPDWTEAAKVHTRKGGTIIPHNKGPGGKSYMQRVQVKHGYCHLTVFATAHRGSDNLTIDGKGYADWIHGLFADGTLEPPPAYVLHNLRAKYERERDVYADRAYNQPSAAPLVKKAEAALAAIDAAIARWAPDEPVAGVPVGLD